MLEDLTYRTLFIVLDCFSAAVRLRPQHIQLLHHGRDCPARSKETSVNHVGANQEAFATADRLKDGHVERWGIILLGYMLPPWFLIHVK